MNCKPGDLAVLVRSRVWPESVGKIVRCVRFDPDRNGLPAWRVDKPVGKTKLFEGRNRPGDWIYDANLRPIRDNDEEDEMLRIVGKPQEVTA